ncbi:MAG: DUF4166 domain-containing protein [Chloroflexi bacterium]|nr:DUF4166 domain-containing protein [Chloroflexota bacterium]
MPAVFRHLFLTPVSDLGIVTLVGTMDRVWMRPRWVRPIFRALELVGVGVAATGEHVPATLEVIQERGNGGAVAVVWRRRFEFPDDRVKRFATTFFRDPIRARVFERAGWGGFLETAWRVEYRAPGTILLHGGGVAVRVFRWRVWLPRLLSLSGTAIQRANPVDPSSFHVDLTFTHPLIGNVYGYEGVFRLERLAPR